MQTYNDLALFYDCRIPRHLRDAALRATPTAGAEYRAMSPIKRLRFDVDREGGAVKLAWLDIRRTCREREGVLVGLLEAIRRYRETSDRYYLGRWRTCREALGSQLRILVAHKARLGQLRRQLATATNEHAVHVND